MYRIIIAIPFLLTFLPLTGSAENIWEDLQQRAASAAQSTREAASKSSKYTSETASKAVATSREFYDDTYEHFNRRGTPEEIMAKVDTLAAESIERLFAENAAARELFEQSFGYAVFEARQISYNVAGGYGYGVAVERDAGERTYMKMATGGVGLSLGLGGFAFRMVFLFEDEPTFRLFVERGYDASAEAGSQIADDVDVRVARFADGVTVFKLTNKAYRLSASLTGTRFWPDDALNQAASHKPKWP